MRHFLLNTSALLFATDAALAGAPVVLDTEAPPVETTAPVVPPEPAREILEYPDPKTDKAGWEKAWNKTITGFKNSVVAAKKYTRQMAEMSLIHFEAYGDVVYIQAAFDNMDSHGKNYVRKQAYKAWAEHFTPLKMENGRFSKDKSDKAVPFNLKGALAVDFWEFAPEQELKTFDAQEVSKLLLAVIGKLRNAEKWSAKDDGALNALNEADKAIRSVFTPKLVEKAPTANAA